MNPTQPPRLHQNQPLVRALPLPTIQPDNYSRAQALNLWSCLLLVSLGLLGHSLPQLLAGFAFAGAWIYGIRTPSEHNYRFYLATGLVVAASYYVLGFLGIR